MTCENCEEEEIKYDYTLDKMPNCTPMVGAVAMLTRYILDKNENTNESFMAIEKVIREHVWKEAQDAYNAGCTAER